MFDHSFSRRFVLKASLAAVSALVLGPSVSCASGGLPAGRLTLLNIHTNDRLTVTYRDPWGAYDPSALKEINWLLRCHYTGQTVDMDTQTIEFLNLVDKNLGGNHEIHVISGYRSPEYNDRLLKAGRQVRKHSLHLSGRAIDIRMPRVALPLLRETALKLRLGGVGYYRESAFVHLDSGRFRSW